jgi:hypothetical protein
MKKMLMTLMAVALVTTGLTMVDARDRSKTITFINDVMVNGTLIGKGTYDIRFDSETNEVAVISKGRQVATAKVEVKVTDRKNLHNSAGYVERDNTRVLTTLIWHHPRKPVSLHHDEDTDEHRQCNAVKKDITKDDTLAAVLPCRHPGNNDRLGIDHLTHDTTRAVGGGGQYR